ncbi:MAG: hypothetical protein MJ201_01535 [Mycoplasmoidaceae bacterium]|nr:hypothetical protein [Mycoplasmoidaceae bacterium]
MEKWVEGFKKKEGIEGSINEMKRIVKNHTDSIPIYEKCDEYVLILVTNNCFPEYLYQLMEHYLNEETEVDGKRQRAFPK